MTPTVHAMDHAVPLKVWDGDGNVPIEQAALQQALNVCALPFIHRHVALMPDAHHGKGSTIGSVIPTRGGRVRPSATMCPLPAEAGKLHRCEDVYRCHGMPASAVDADLLALCPDALDDKPARCVWEATYLISVEGLTTLRCSWHTWGLVRSR